MKRTQKVMKTTLAAASLLAAGVGCGTEEREPLSDVEVEGIPELSQPLTAFDGSCTYDASTKTATIDYGSVATLILSKRIADSALLLNGDDLECTISGTAATVKTSSIKTLLVTNTTSTASAKLILDYNNGTFALGTSTAAGTQVSGVTGAGSAFKIRGTNSTDKVYLAEQATGTLGVSMGGRFIDITVAGLNGTGTGAARAVTPALTIDTAGGSDIVRFAPTGVAAGTKLEDTMTKFNPAWVAEVYGAAGNDIFEMGDGVKGSVILHGGDGTDTVNYDERTSPVYVQLSASTRISGDFSDNTAANREFDQLDVDLEKVVGGSGNDVFDVAARAVAATNATQTFDGGAGDDFFLDFAISHKTVFIGGAGTDTVSYGGRAAAVTVTMGSGDDDGDQTASSVEEDDVQSTIEQLVGSQGNDTLTGSSKADVICGGAGNDTIDGGAGDDIFAVVLGAPIKTTFKQDWTTLGAVKSVLCNDTGGDTYTGGAGVDLVDYSLRGASLADPTVVASTAGAVGAVTITVLMDGSAAGSASNEDQVDEDVEDCFGTTGVDSITGNDANNVIWGNGGADTLLSGGAGNDTIEAAATAVTCDCGGGEDILVGGGGAACTTAVNGCEL